MSRRLICLAACALASGPLRAGVTYLHNQAYAEIATNLQAQASDWGKEDLQLYKAMLENLQKFQVEEEGLLAEFAENYQNALAARMPDLGWPALLARFDKLKDESLPAFGKAIADSITSYFADQKQLQAAKKSAADQIAALDKQIGAASARIDSWNQRIALFYEGFQHIPGTSPTNTPVRSVNDLTKAAKKAVGTPIVYRSADGQTKTNTVGAILSAQAKDAVAGRTAGGEAPGLTLTTLGLALDLAKAEKQYAERELLQLKRRAAVYKEALAYQQTAVALLPAGARDQYQLSPDNPVLDAWHSRTNAIGNADFGSRHNSVNAVAANMVLLRSLASAEFLSRYAETRFRVAVARLEHEESILLSEKRDQVYRRIISRSADALAAYYKGGFTAEDFANVMRLAQSVAVFLIANDIN